MSIHHVVQQTQQALQLPVRQDYPCEQTVVKAKASENATWNTQQPGATAEHQPPSRSTCSMTLRTNFVSQLEVCHSEFVVRAGTDIIPIESWLRTGGEADKHPFQLVTRSLNLHIQPHLISENSPTCTLTSMNANSSDFCSSVTNDCSSKLKAALPALVESRTLPVHSGYDDETMRFILLLISRIILFRILICVFYPWV